MMFKSILSYLRAHTSAIKVLVDKIILERVKKQLQGD